MLNRNLMLGIFQSVNGNYEKERRNWKTRDTYELKMPRNKKEESHIFSCLLIISSFSSKHYRKSLLVWTSSWEKSHYLEENPWNENWWLMNALKARTLSIFLQLLAKHKKRKGNIGHYIQEEMKINCVPNFKEETNGKSINVW